MFMKKNVLRFSSLIQICSKSERRENRFTHVSVLSRILNINKFLTILVDRFPIASKELASWAPPKPPNDTELMITMTADAPQRRSSSSRLAGCRVLGQGRSTTGYKGEEAHSNTRPNPTLPLPRPPTNLQSMI